MKNSKYVTDYFVTLMPNGVYNLVFNMTERWLHAHRYNNTTYTFGTDVEGETIEESNERIQEIPEFLPVLEKGHFVSSVLIDKDQIHFFFIPYYHEWAKLPDKIILSSK